MILKSADERNEDLSVLKCFLERPNLSKSQVSKISKTIAAIRTGVSAESEAAYHINFGLKNSPNWIVIHDLRIEEQGRVAQIDHLLINRFLNFWICETKHFAQGIAINDFGEFTSFYGKTPISIPSPIEQNRRHVSVLEQTLQSERVTLPRRMRRQMTPKLSSHILVSAKARISRPNKPVDGIETIIKTDQFDKRIKEWRDSLNLLSLHKVISCSTLENLGRQIVKLHTPVKIDWEAKFGLEAQKKTVGRKKTELIFANQTKVKSNKKSKLICTTCDISVSYAVAKFCWFNKSKFGGDVYCMDCQKTVTASK